MGCISVFKPSSPGQQQSNMSANVVCCDSVLPLHYFKISSLKNNKWENSWMSTHTKFFSNKNTDFCVRHGCSTALVRFFRKLISKSILADPLSQALQWGKVLVLQQVVLLYKVVKVFVESIAMCLCPNLLYPRISHRLAKQTYRRCMVPGTCQNAQCRCGQRSCTTS